jgi:DNA-binding transcriptional regulator PaaX
MAKFWRKNNLTKDTLLKLVLGGAVVLVAASSPYFLHQVARNYFKEKIKKAIAARARKLRDLERRKIVSFKELNNGEIRIELTHQGKLLIRQYRLDDLKLNKPKAWDKKWRVIIYDIPHHFKKARDAFRRKIGEMGLYPLQKSVWVSPYECWAEIEFLCSVFDIDIDSHVYCLTIIKIPKEGEIKKWFDL